LFHLLHIVKAKNKYTENEGNKEWEKFSHRIAQIQIGVTNHNYTCQHKQGSVPSVCEPGISDIRSVTTTSS
jgi:hypothetical protein